MDNPMDLKALAELLQPPEEYETKGSAKPPSAMGPGDLLPKTIPKKKEEIKSKRQGTAIWEEDEVKEVEKEENDPRKHPKYEILYKQKVGSEDVYLGIGGLNPSSRSCQYMVVHIDLPGTNSVEEVDLDVTKTKLTLYTKQYRLLLHLGVKVWQKKLLQPHPVEDAKGKAAWLEKKERLTVTLPILWEDESHGVYQRQ